MKRREFVRLLGGAAVAAPIVAHAQQAPMPVVGFLSSETRDRSTPRLRAFREGLSELGYVEGRNVTILYRWADGQIDRLPELAEDLVRRNVNVMAVISGVPAVKAAKAATRSVPTVFQIAGDPVKLEFVASLNRPGGNLTGVTSMSMEVGPKRLELMHELLPNTDNMALLVNPANTDVAEALSRDLLAAGRKLGLEVRIFEARGESDFETVFTAIAQSKIRAVVIGDDALFNIRVEKLGSLALRSSLPAIFQYREFVASGGMMSYGGSIAESSRKVGVYTGRILKGDKPSDLPVQQGTKFDLIINLKTAKALGLTVPATLLALADEVIE